MAGAPVGNKNATKSRRLFSNALKRLFAQNPEKADALARKLVQYAEEGQGWAFKELLDRLDGKVPQPVVGDDESPPISVREILIRAVDATTDRAAEESS